jgi:hypothetical protein
MALPIMTVEMQVTLGAIRLILIMLAAVAAGAQQVETGRVIPMVAQVAQLFLARQSQA